MAVKSRTLTQEIAWRLAEVYAAQTHGNYDEETLFDRGGDWAADEVGKVLSERLGVPTEALEAGVVLKFIEEATETALEMLDRIEALEAENERLRQIEAAARTLVDTAFEVPGPDEYVYQAVRVDHFGTLAALLKGEGGATHA